MAHVKISVPAFSISLIVVFKLGAVCLSQKDGSIHTTVVVEAEGHAVGVPGELTFSQNAPLVGVC